MLRWLGYLLESLLAWFKKYLLLFSATLAHLFHPLIVSIEETTLSYPQPKLSRVSALKLVKFYKNTEHPGTY